MDNMQHIPICFTFNANYLVGGSVTIFSMLKNANPIYYYDLYIIHSDISIKDQNRLMKVVKKFSNASLTFKEFDYSADSWNKLANKAHFSKEIFNKLILSRIFPEYDRILLSDVDVLFLGDLSPSFFLFPDEFFYYAGVGTIFKFQTSYLYEAYYSKAEISLLSAGCGSGYLLVNLKYIREKGKDKELNDFYINNLNRLILPEQDCINIVAHPHIKYLPFNYCVCPFFYKSKNNSANFNSNIKDAEIIFKDLLRNPILLHYIGPLKPWNSFFIHKQGIWFKYLIKGGLFIYYLRKLPAAINNRLKRYSLKRFIQKKKQNR
jgi:lipopolysaccharide biosynthesis glycosyltransferase